MTFDEALTALKIQTAADTAPAVADAELVHLLNACQVIDAEGRAPVDANWVPRWDLGLARAKVYELKAARVAHEVSFTADGARFDLDARRKGYLDLADRERKQRAGSVPY